MQGCGGGDPRCTSPDGGGGQDCWICPSIGELPTCDNGECGSFTGYVFHGDFRCPEGHKGPGGEKPENYNCESTSCCPGHECPGSPAEESGNRPGKTTCVSPRRTPFDPSGGPQDQLVLQQADPESRTSRVRGHFKSSSGSTPRRRWSFARGLWFRLRPKRGPVRNRRT